MPEIPLDDMSSSSTLLSDAVDVSDIVQQGHAEAGRGLARSTQRRY